MQDVGIALPFGDNVESFMDTLDYDGNGLVAFDEFCSGDFASSSCFWPSVVPLCANFCGQKKRERIRLYLSDEHL